MVRTLVAGNQSQGTSARLLRSSQQILDAFFCAGYLAETLGTHHVREMGGVGHRMPWTTGAMPLLARLPQAPPVAPTPASAVLRGAMIKAGPLGRLRFSSLGTALLIGRPPSPVWMRGKTERVDNASSLRVPWLTTVVVSSSAVRPIPFGLFHETRGAAPPS